MYLGISQDRYESGVALTDGQRVLYAANEERFTRKKNQGGFPFRALASAFAATGVHPRDVDGICVAGLTTPPFPLRLIPSLQAWVFDEDRTGRRRTTDRLVDFLVYHTPIAHTSSDSVGHKLTLPFLAPAVRRTLPAALRGQPIQFVEHHRAHAAVAWCLSGFEEALCLTGDCLGDGLSMTVSRMSPDGATRLWTASSRDSLGGFYEMVTEALGFIPSRHEGKVTGLAAYGDAGRVDVGSPFRFENDQLRYAGPRGRQGVSWVRQELCSRYRREDIARWAQEILERNVLDIARTWLRRTELGKLAVGGGIFANVKLNQRLCQLDEVMALFVCPNMGDGGLSLGAVCAAGGLDTRRTADVFWGESFDANAVTGAMRAHRLDGYAMQDIDEKVAELVAQGYVVARFRGPMEWGPRALGNRSILAPTDDPDIVGRLNALLQRSEFMPFAPALREEDADDYCAGLASGRSAAEFMTVCCEASERLKRGHPAIVHVDGTIRPQLVRREANPSLHRILTAYKRRSGHGVMLNTSFNVHEEPIVCTPEDAIRTFLKARLDFLALENWLVPAAHVASRATANGEGGSGGEPLHADITAAANGSV